MRRGESGGRGGKLSAVGSELSRSRAGVRPIVAKRCSLGLVRSGAKLSASVRNRDRVPFVATLSKRTKRTSKDLPLARRSWRHFIASAVDLDGSPVSADPACVAAWIPWILRHVRRVPTAPDSAQLADDDWDLAGSFDAFPERVVHILKASHPKVAFENQVYPPYDTRGELPTAGKPLDPGVMQVGTWLTSILILVVTMHRTWLENLVQTREAAYKAGGGAGPVRVVLLGHSFVFSQLFLLLLPS